MLDRRNEPDPVWLSKNSCSLEEFRTHVEQRTDHSLCRRAVDIVSNIPVYDGVRIAKDLKDDADWLPLMAEWNRLWAKGPGIVMVRRGFADIGLLDAVTDKLSEISREEEIGHGGKGDHFAAAGANSRVWNSHEKLCMKSPELFARYNANEFTRRLSEAWLGSGYQITAQANVVHPGGKAQIAHRDYHMGFQSEKSLLGYPAMQHALSAYLTLQGAVAHTDMPVESGPTKMLPYSQSYLPGYLAVLRPEFRAYFEENFVQLPLQKGDMVFFNPATFHAAGENRTTDLHRFANLMQVGSPYGRSIEIVDRVRIAKAVYAPLAQLRATGVLDAREVDNVVAATAEGYPFPVNLDIDAPIGGMAPPSQQDVMRQALAEGWPAEKFASEIDAHASRKRSH